MFDQAFNKTTISNLIRNSDFDKHSALYNEDDKNDIINNAVNKSKVGFNDPNDFILNIKGGMNLLKTVHFYDELVLRKASGNLKKLTSVKQNNRNIIVNNLITFLKEGVEYRLYKLDIKSFYESISTEYISEKINQDIYLSNATKKCIGTFLKISSDIGISGIARGIQLSATLAELSLRNFDRLHIRNQSIFFYSRFVDDIIFITSSSENKTTFLKEIKLHLSPLGLRLNQHKQYIQKVDRINKNLLGTLCDFNYLGYTFKVNNQPIPGQSIKSTYRNINIDIAPKKVKRIKTRIVLSLLSYIDSPDNSLLRDRLKILTSNYSIIDRTTGLKRKAGIYYNYNHVNQFSSGALEELDTFLRRSLLSNKGKIYSIVNPIIPMNIRKKLLKLTFSNGFKNKVFFDFNQYRMSEIMRCWKYE